MMHKEKIRDVIADAIVSEIVVNDGDFEDFDPESVTMDQFVKLSGKSRAIISDWIVSWGMPRNPDKSFNLRKVNSWYKRHILQIRANKKRGLKLTEIFRNRQNQQQIT